MTTLGVVAPEALGFVVLFDGGDEFFVAAAGVHVGEGLLIDGEEADGGAVFGGHVGDGGRAWQARYFGEAGAVELDEFFDDAVLAEDFGDGEDDVGGGDAFFDFAGEFEADDFGEEHVDGLAEHDGFGLNAADAPAPTTSRPLIMVVWELQCRRGSRGRGFRLFPRRLWRGIRG